MIFYQNKKYLVFSTCIFIEGAKRGAFYDISRSHFDFMPNDFTSLVENVRTPNNQIINNVSDELFDFLFENEYIFEFHNVDENRFPPLNLKWDNPFQISNAIIDITDLTVESQASRLNFVNELGCQNFLVQNDSYNKAHDSNFKLLSSLLDGSSILNLDFILNGKHLSNYWNLKSVVKKCILINSILLYNSLTDKSLLSENVEECLLLIKKDIYSNASYKKSISNFIVNMQLFTESQLHHTYFNRKLYIGPKGEIKNAPECEEEFGFIQDLKSPDDLKEIVATPAFQKYWFVHKELCDVCKDCEFRHMCVDNRLPYQRKDKTWYHKQECNYNPYICKWEGEEGYKTLAECGVEVTENGYTRNDKKIEAINEVLWAE